MMRHWFIILLVCCIEYPSLASCDTLDVGNDNRMARHDCSSVLKQLRADVRNEETRAIPLQTPGLKARDDLDGDAGKPCADFERVKHALHGSSVSDIERGLLGGKRAAVLSDGPHGSGHYWQLTLAVQMNDQVVGACLITKTAGWRNIPAKGLPHFGQWHSLSNDRFRLWSELVAGESQSQSLIIPLVFRLSKRTLVLDLSATRIELGLFGEKYAALSTMRKDGASDLHRAAAAAYRAFSLGVECPP
ncbi:MAG: hypothetical protein JNM83_04975 [Myxococcales bacterium]|nr:hypothetical protein [Myxococcales bacterium]